MRPEDPHVEPPAEAAPSDDEVCPPPSTEPPTLAAPSPLVFRDLFAALTAPREEQIEAPRPPP
ncbi:hypothetical protein KKF91_17580, partial [Myxococcota bacterium]|nr:hypothetical protein [Myxococcota bacterium]